MENKNKNTAPLKACVFDRLCEVQFGSQDDKEGNDFSITAYSGQIITNHWYWGNLGFDLKGIAFAKKVSPVLEEHFRSSRLGFTTKQEATDKVVVEGKFLSNQTAQQMKGDIKEGFPMQASMYLVPTIIERIADGETSKVNGHTLKGPGTVFRKSTIKEISMCVFGADDNTQSLAAAEDDEKQIQFNTVKKENEIMADTTKQEITAETFAADNPVLFEKIKSDAKAEGKAEGEKETMDRFGKFTEKFGDDPAFVIEQFKTKATLAAAVEAENAKLKKEASDKASDKDTETKVEAAETEFSDEQKQEQENTQNSNTAGEPTTFDEAVEKRVNSDNSDKSEVSKKAAATRFCVGKYPELHKKMLEENIKVETRR